MKQRKSIQTRKPSLQHLAKPKSVPSTPAPSSATKDLLTLDDWDFSQVKPEELGACCFYEYLRESPQFVGYMDQGVPIPNAPANLNFCHRAAVAGTFRTFPSPQSMFLWVRGGNVSFKRTPWAKLSKEYRRQVGEQFLHNAVVYWDAFGSADSGRVPEGFISRGSKRDGIHPETGIERIAVEIDWATFDDADIVKSFKDWVHKNRPSLKNGGEWLQWMPTGFPKNIGYSVRKGPSENETYRNSLERLGIFRLRKKLTFEEMREFLSAVWSDEAGEKRLDQSKYNNVSECNREFQKAMEDFGNVFPFLPKLRGKAKRAPYIRNTPMYEEQANSYVSGASFKTPHRGGDEAPAEP